ncbi:MAG: hypothetical protein WAX04_06110, partial [Oscillospiraceae bacterium]
MEKEQIVGSNIDINKVEMPIKKVFMLIGVGLSLSVILLNVVQILVVSIFRKHFPDIYDTSFFRFAASTIPLTIVAMPVLFAVTSFIPSTKTSDKSKISFKNMFKIFVISYAAMTFINIFSTLIN